jgi:hypothetical protein
MSGAAAAIAAVPGLIQSGYGLYQAISGNKQRKQLEANRPTRRTDQNFLQNQSIARNVAQGGFGQQYLNTYTDEANRGLATAIGALQQGGGDMNQINSLLDSTNRNFQKFLSMDAQQKLQNQGMLMDANAVIGQENNANWEFNTARPWYEHYNQAIQKTNAGAQNAIGGLKDAVSSAMGGMSYGGGGGSNYGAMINQATQSGGYATSAPTQGYGTAVSGMTSPYGTWNPYQ